MLKAMKLKMLLEDLCLAENKFNMNVSCLEKEINMFIRALATLMKLA